jgi:cytochrome P450
MWGNGMSGSGCPVGAPVVEYFDHHSPEYASRRFEWYETIRESAGPVFWTPHWGGYWVVIGWEELTAAAKDWETFSSRPFGDSEGDLRFNGHFVPTAVDLGDTPVGDGPGGQLGTGGRSLLGEDPPIWNDSRKLMAPIFAPNAVEAWRPRMFDLVNACIDRHIETGSIDFAQHVTNIVPAIFSLELIGVSPALFEQVAKSNHEMTHLAPGQTLPPEVAAGMGSWAVELTSILQNPGAERRGVIGYLLDAREGGTELTDADIMGLAGITIGGGLDTTSAALGTTLVLLTEYPELREPLREHPELIHDAAEEFLRIAAPTQGLCRTVTRDVDLGGQQLRRGDRVMMCFAAANRDPRAFECPQDIVLDRKKNRHVTFGSGIHRCIGSQFAKLEWEATVTTVLERMPDFEVDLEQARSYENVGIVTGWRSVPATFTPGPRIGIDPGIPGWKF